MFEAAPSPYLVPFDGTFLLDGAPTAPPEDAPGEAKAKKRLEDLQDELDDAQRRLYADDRVSVLLIFQAMDAAGKDSTIRAVMRGINPAGCQVSSFKQPSATELDHDFLWRSCLHLPERGRIGIFNRSYYEEVLVVRVHPEYLAAQRLPWAPEGEALWSARFDSIRDHEHHLVRNGTVVLKFFLNVSKEEQRRRFLSRIDEQKKNWKFSAGDVKEREHWDEYMRAYEAALNATSRSWAPWYAIPADDKPYMRMRVAEIFLDTLQSLDLRFPRLGEDEEADLQRMRAVLEAQDPSKASSPDDRAVDGLRVDGLDSA